MLASLRNRIGLSARQRVMVPLLDQFSGKLQSCPHIVDTHIVFPLDFLKTHPPCEAPDNQRYRRLRSTYHRLPVANLRINDDSFIHRNCTV
jgi:hypothetical protein